MSPTLFLRLATVEDLSTLVRWRRETARWLASAKATDQWAMDYSGEKLMAWINAGETFMASLAPGDDPVATITVTSTGDPELWTPDELQIPAYYLNKVNVVRSYAGRGIGECLIRWGIHRAATSDVDVVRIDVWSTNTALQKYYEQMGFRYLRTVPGVNSGALFEIPAVRNSDLPVVAPCAVTE